MILAPPFSQITGKWTPCYAALAAAQHPKWRGHYAANARGPQLRLVHSTGCANQNVLHPDGRYEGAAECGCQRSI